MTPARPEGIWKKGGMTSLIPNLDTRWQGVVSHTHRGHSTPEERTLNTRWRGRLVGPTAYLDAFEKRKTMNRTTIPQMTRPYQVSVKITLSSPLYCWNVYCETKKKKKKNDINKHFFSVRFTWILAMPSKEPALLFPRESQRVQTIRQAQQLWLIPQVDNWLLPSNSSS